MRRGRATAIAGLVLLVAGCGGGADGPDDPATGSADPSPTASASTPTSSESPEGAAPTPTVEPATGVELDVVGFRVNAPEKWHVNNTFVTAESAIGPVDDGRTGRILLGVVGSDEQLSLRQAMRRSWRSRVGSGGAQVKPDGFEEHPSTVLGGLSAYYYTARPDRFTTDHVMGHWDSGVTVQLRIGLPVAMSPARQKEIVDSIVATYRSRRDG